MNLRPNKDIERSYKRKLFTMIRWMNKKTLEELTRIYRKHRDRIVGDSRPSTDFKKIIRELQKKYENIFKKRSKDYAETALDDTLEYTDLKLENEITKLKRKIDEKAKKYKINSTPQSIKDIKGALLEENIALIKSIPAKYFDQIENDVYLSLAEGANLTTLTDRLEKNYGIARRRAVIIARDQTNKANSLLSIKRSESLGIKKGIWRHSGAGKEPRKSHVEADGEIFDLAKGLKIDGEYTFPSYEINCFSGNNLLTDTPVIEKLYRRWYTGKTAEIITDNGTISGVTPNHPVLTIFGWKAIKDLKIGDQLIFASNQGIDGIDDDQQKGVMLQDLFEFYHLIGVDFTSKSTTTSGDFHGDGVIDKKVDVIDVTSLLRDIGEIDLSEKFTEFGLSKTDIGDIACFLSGYCPSDSFLKRIRGSSERIIGGFSSCLALFLSKLTSRELVSFTSCARSYIVSKATIPNDFSGNTEFFSNRILCISGLIQRDYGRIKEFIFNRLNLIARNDSSHGSKFLRDIIGVSSNNERDFFQGFSLTEKIGNIVEINFNDFSGHVYNLQTELGYYNIKDLYCQNCRCYYEPSFDILDEPEQQSQESLTEQYVLSTRDVKAHNYKNTILVEIGKDYQSSHEGTQYIALPKKAWVKTNKGWDIDFNVIRNNDEFLMMYSQKTVGTASFKDKWEKVAAKNVNFDKDIIQNALKKRDLREAEKNRFKYTKEEKRERKERNKRIRESMKSTETQESMIAMRKKIMEEAKKAGNPYVDLNGKWVVPKKK